MLPRLVGVQKAMALMLTAEKVSAADAEKMNMIYKAIADDAFEHYVDQLSAQLAQMPTTGFGLTKKAVNAALRNTLENQLALEEQLQTQAGQTHDFKEGVAAFLEKRKPEFKGN